MKVKPASRKQIREYIALFDDLNLSADGGGNWLYPRIVTHKSGALIVVSPHSISPERFEKALHGLSTIFNRSIIGIKDYGSHRWLLLEDRLPDLVPYSSRPEGIPCGQFWLGTYSDGSPVILDFKHSPVLLVAGASGSGKSELFKVLLKEIERTWGADTITIAEGTKDGNDFRHQSCRRLATDIESVLEVYREMASIYEERKQHIKELDVGHWLEARAKGYDWKPYYLLIDECPVFLSPPKKGQPDFETKSEIVRIASHLAMRGRYVGLFQILGTQDPSATGLPSDIMNQIRLKIGYGMRTAEMARAYFGQSAPHADDLTQGKGIAMLGSAPLIFRGSINSLEIGQHMSGGSAPLIFRGSIN